MAEAPDGIVKIEAPALVLPPNDAPRNQDPASPTTTIEQDRHSSIARYQNMMWEATQGVIAISVTMSTLYVLVSLSLIKNETALNALCSMFGLVIGFYFGRTNHARAGGVART